jgi:hypothetical protein
MRTRETGQILNKRQSQVSHELPWERTESHEFAYDSEIVDVLSSVII